ALQVTDTVCRLVLVFVPKDGFHVVILIVVVVAIVGVIIVVVIFGVVAYAFHQDKASSVRVPVANVTLSSSAHLLRENTNSVLAKCFLLGLLALAMVAVCASRAAVKSAISCRMASKVMAGVSDVDVLLGGILSTQDNAGYGMIHEDGDNDAIGGNDDEGEIIEEEDGEWIRFLGGNSSSGTKKYRGSNSSDGDNIRDGVKIAGGVIGLCEIVKRTAFRWKLEVSRRPKYSCKNNFIEEKASLQYREVEWLGEDIVLINQNPVEYHQEEHYCHSEPVLSPDKL
ncbi:hypothetical protein Tco_0785676, partial [Tanacetum coccineum]